MSEPVLLVVRIGDCPCPGTPHTEEQVYLEPELSLPAAAAAYVALQNSDGTLGGYEAALVESYIPRGIRSWSFLERDEDGTIGPVPVSRDNVERLLPWDRGGLELADRMDGLYSARLMRPLVARLSMPSPPLSTVASTSANRRSGGRTRKSSTPSLPNGGAGRPFVDPAR